MISFIINQWGRVRSAYIIQEWRAVLGLALIPLSIIISVYIWQEKFDSSQPGGVVLSASSTASESLKQKDDKSGKTQKESEEIIVVEVSGAVVKPGVKELPSGSRVHQALSLAGGYNQNADKEYLAQVLNLAQKIHDGDKLYIPTYYQVSMSLPAPVVLKSKVGDPIAVLSGSNESSGGSDESVEKISKSGEGGGKQLATKVNINTASMAELDELPGIGPANAQRIVDNRPYASTVELCERKILTSQSTCEEILDSITTE